MISYDCFSIPNREPPPLPRCPECGTECYKLYRDSTGMIVGCENCIEELDAIDYLQGMEDWE
jgi:hypothetical protein